MIQKNKKNKTSNKRFALNRALDASIISYVKKHPNCLAIDVVVAMDISLSKIFHSIARLIDQGKLDVKLPKNNERRRRASKSRE